jgi:hypothetical protein
LSEERNAMSLPSGEYAGCNSVPSLWVRFTAVRTRGLAVDVRAADHEIRRFGHPAKGSEKFEPGVSINFVQRHKPCRLPLRSARVQNHKPTMTTIM